MGDDSGNNKCYYIKNMNLLSIVECAIMFVTITFIDLTLSSAIMLYLMAGMLLIAITL